MVGETGKFKTPFGTFIAPKWAKRLIALVLVLIFTAWGWNTQGHKMYKSLIETKRSGQIAEIDLTLRELADHALIPPEWTFTSPSGDLYGEGFSDAVCMEWRGQFNRRQLCMVHPDEAGQSPIPPGSDMSGAGILVSSTPPTRCGPYYYPEQHGYFYFKDCAARGDWVRFCFYFHDGCRGYRDYNARYDVWAEYFFWTYCQH